jgi:CBS domain containing-hemolysin-like protein
MSPPVALVVGAVLVAGNAFFVASEFALVAVRRSQIEPRARAGSWAARVTLAAMEDVSLMIAGIQLGVTVCSVVLGAVAEPGLAHVLEPLWRVVHLPHDARHPLAFAVALVLVAFLHVVFGEMVPKNVTLARPERAALLLCPPIFGFVRALRPLIVGLSWFAQVVLRLLGIKPKDEVASAFTREEVAAIVEESRGEGLIAADQYDRLAGALGFTEKTVAQITLPLDRLTTVRRGSTGADVEDLCGATGYSRFPVARDDGELMGYLHLKDVLEDDEENRNRPVEDKWIRPFAAVSAGDALHDALETLQRRGTHMARVVDRDGTTVGIATLEDLIEELVGEIRDAAHSAESEEPDAGSPTRQP